jgi:hypothetical protein
MAEWQRGWRGHVYKPYIPPSFPLTKVAINASYGKQKVVKRMSGVLWCEAQGWANGHAFSDKDPEVQTFTRALKVPVSRGNSYGRPVIQEETRVEEEFHICGPHAREQGLFQPEDTPEIEPTHKGYDPEYTKKLEKELDRLNSENEGLRDQ